MSINALKIGIAALGILGTVDMAISQTAPLPVKISFWCMARGSMARAGSLCMTGLFRMAIQSLWSQEPLTSFSDDVAATKRVLSQQQGPCILVGHSYGGSIITEAGTDSHAVGLVYIAAHMPDAGESEALDGKRFPSIVSSANVITKSSDGFTFLEPAAFPTYFAADLPREQASFEARSQIETAQGVFSGVITTPAWKNKPSWMLVAGADKIISPDLERWYAQRAHSYTSEVEGASHSVYESHPKEVVRLIEDAAKNLRN